ncbi:Protein max like protein [Argiope bruennichi]|uniref:Protein max like protein n=1 Tax=Argiope bruennichi TaxID=94029 RepID=A0A8T0EUZ1_ARGBR|nr:Protein max like protein [Argiope bruennichi]
MSDDEELSDERYDSEVEDDEKVFESDAGKRAYHNLLERKRRDNIKDSFCQLRDVLPSFSKKKKASRVQILKKSCDFIKQQPELQKLKEETASLEEENRLLEKSIASLDEAIANNDLETIARFERTNLPLKRRYYMLESEDTGSDDHETSDEDGGSSPPEPSPVPAPQRKRISLSLIKTLNYVCIPRVKSGSSVFKDVLAKAESGDISSIKENYPGIFIRYKTNILSSVRFRMEELTESCGVWICGPPRCRKDYAVVNSGHAPLSHLTNSGMVIITNVMCSYLILNRIMGSGLVIFSRYGQIDNPFNAEIKGSNVFNEFDISFTHRQVAAIFWTVCSSPSSDTNQLTSDLNTLMHLDNTPTPAHLPYQGKMHLRSSSGKSTRIGPASYQRAKTRYTPTSNQFSTQAPDFIHSSESTNPELTITDRGMLNISQNYMDGIHDCKMDANLIFQVLLSIEVLDSLIISFTFRMFVSGIAEKYAIMSVSSSSLYNPFLPGQTSDEINKQFFIVSSSDKQMCVKF